MKTKAMEFFRKLLLWALVAGFSLAWGYSTTFAADAALKDLSINGASSLYENTSSKLHRDGKIQRRIDSNSDLQCILVGKL